MKYRLFLLLLATILLIATMLGLCFRDTLQVRWSINCFRNVLDGELPEDLTLTIYYLPSYILTRAPLTVKDLMEMELAVKIVVDSNELKNHLSAIRQLNLSNIQPAKENVRLNARLYYVFELGKSEKILEVAMQQFVGNTVDVGAFVSGIAVEKNPVLYEIIMPFLEQEDIDHLGIENAA